MPPGPAEDREVSNRNVATRERNFAEPAVEHAVEAARLLRVPLEAVTPVLLVSYLQEMMHLPWDRPEAAHLPHQPLEHGHLPPQIGGPKFAGLRAEIDQDGTGFEDADRRTARAFGIDDRRDLAVRADFHKGGGELLALADVYRLDGVGQSHLFQRDADLAAIRGVPGVQFDGHRDAPFLMSGSRWANQDYPDRARLQDATRLWQLLHGRTQSK